jgi:sulfatase modifying factor 1
VRLSFQRFAKATFASVARRKARGSKSRLPQRMPLELQSLEPRLALAVADTIAPTVKSIAAPSAKTYAAGSTLSFKATFTEKVFATGVPTLPITIGDTVRQATWDGKGSGGKALVFRTTVQAGDLAPTGVSVAGPIGLSGGATIRDKAGNALIPAATGTFTKAKVDAVGPSVTSFTWGAATGLGPLKVTFTEPVVVRVRGRPPFALAGTHTYTSGSGSNVLVFSYKRPVTKPPVTEVPTLPSVFVQTLAAIRLNGGAITDRFGNHATSLAKPTDVQLSATSIPENQPSGTVVSTLSAVDSDGSRDRHTFSLVAGTGSADNASFQIVGSQLRTTGPFDFETKASYAVRVRTADAGGLSFEKAFTITVTNVNEMPTDIALSGASVAENQPSGTAVGTFTTTDPDAGNTFTYTLVSGEGSADNASFTIDGSVLKTAASFNFEGKSSYSVRVKSTDAGGLSTEKAFTIANVDVVVQFVRVGDAGNAADTDPAGYGAVGYEYWIGAYEVTIGQYTKFLNAVAKTDTYGLYNTFMGTDLNIAGISRSGSPGSYTYAVMNNGGDSSNRPITYVSWFDAARFANWIHNGQLAGSQNATTTEDGAYTLNGATSGTAPAKNAGARFYIPTENEWYKAAYYKGGSTNAGYWDYATKSDSAPGNIVGSGTNQANYQAPPNYNFSVTQLAMASYSANQNYLTNVGAFTGSQSAYGTFDQSGNVYEWNDLTDAAGSYRGLRGGVWGDYLNPFGTSSSISISYVPSDENYLIGFRLASPV